MRLQASRAVAPEVRPRDVRKGRVFLKVLLLSFDEGCQEFLEVQDSLFVELVD